MTLRLLGEHRHPWSKITGFFFFWKYSLLMELTTHHTHKDTLCSFDPFSSEHQHDLKKLKRKKRFVQLQYQKNIFYKKRCYEFFFSMVKKGLLLSSLQSLSFSPSNVCIDFFHAALYSLSWILFSKTVCPCCLDPEDRGQIVRYLLSQTENLRGKTQRSNCRNSDIIHVNLVYRGALVSGLL